MLVLKYQDHKHPRVETIDSSLQFHITGHHRRKLGQELKQYKNLEVEAEAETMEGCC